MLIDLLKVVAILCAYELSRRWFFRRFATRPLPEIERDRWGHENRHWP